MIKIINNSVISKEDQEAMSKEFDEQCKGCKDKVCIPFRGQCDIEDNILHKYEKRGTKWEDYKETNQ
jgi:hypothetical protein